MGKTLGSSPGSKGMGTGRTYPNLEHIKYGNRFVWQVINILAKLRATFQISGFPGTKKALRKTQGC
jgi:hypothetical protein